MQIVKTKLPKKFHDAVVRWRDTFIPDYPLLEEHWEKYFPHQPPFELCAMNDCSICPNIEVGDHEGRPKFCRANEMNKEQADHLLKAVRAQASTELGSIQQHRLTLARAQAEQDQFWILRMMAEELRHGYQMFHVLLNDDWKAITDTSGEEMVEEVLNMRTGSHVLGAFNIDFDSFVDNIVFCALIDRVGKYQLMMQKVSAYKPMAESMPPMLREEAFHLATGVTPMRRWVAEAAVDEGHVSLEMLQKAIFKWFPRALDMFGDERGGGRNVRFGFKTMANGEALEQYVEEVRQIVHDLNLRYLRTRYTDLTKEQAEARIESRKDVLLRLPAVSFLRRRGPHAYLPHDIDGRRIDDAHEFRRHLELVLPEAYHAGRDFAEYTDLVRQVAAGELTQPEAAGRMPVLSRVGGTCPCSNAVRWVQPDA